MRAAGREGVPDATMTNDADFDAVDGERAHEAVLEISDGGDAMELSHMLPV